MNKHLKYSDAAAAVLDIFRIWTRCGEEIGAVVQRFKARHGEYSPERICYFASLAPSFTDREPCPSDAHPGYSFTVPLVIRIVYGHFTRDADPLGAFKNFKYFREKGF